MTSREAASNWMNARVTACLLAACLTIGWLAVACRQPSAPATLVPTARPLGGGQAAGNPEIVATEAPSPTASQIALRAFVDEAAGFSLKLPADWTISQPSRIALGTLYQLGPAPLGPGPSSSALILVDTQRWDIRDAALQLECGDDCGQNDDVSLLPIQVGELRGQKVVIGATRESPLEWFFINRSGRLLAFTLHDPETLRTLDQVVESVVLAEPTPSPTALPTATSTPSTTPTPAPSPTPSQTPRPSPTARANGPTERLIDFIDSFTYDPSGEEARSFLSDRLSEQVADGAALLDLLAIDPYFKDFRVAWSDTAGTTVNFEVTMDYRDAPVSRQAAMVFESDEWRVDQFAIVTPPQATATLTPTPTPTEGQ